MTDAELKAIIQAAGGKCWALEYADALLEKINRLEAASKYASLFTQLRSAKESGDFRSRVLEVNFANIFLQKGIALLMEPNKGCRATLISAGASTAIRCSLSGEVVWNPALIDCTRAESVLDAFHQIVLS